MERITGWQSRMADGRVEILVRSKSLRIRAHGTPEQMNELLDWFEAQEGCAVEAPWRVRRAPAPIPGQLSLVDAP